MSGKTDWEGARPFGHFCGNGKSDKRKVKRLLCGASFKMSTGHFSLTNLGNAKKKGRGHKALALNN